MKKLLNFFSYIAVGITLTTITIGGFCWIKPQYSEYCALKDQRDDLEQTVEHKESELRNLRSKIQRFHTDPAFVELIARRAKRIRPNEIVFEATED